MSLCLYEQILFHYIFYYRFTVYEIICVCVCVCVKNVVLHVWIHLNNRCNAWCCYEWENFRFLRPKRGKFFPIPSLSGQYKNFNISILTYKCQHSFQAMRTSACFCITGWLAVFFSKVFNFTHTYIPTYTEISMDLDLNVMLQSLTKKKNDVTMWCRVLCYLI